MKPLSQLLDHADPGMPLVRQWLEEAQCEYQLLAPSADCDRVLLGLQVTTRSILGAIAHDTGGLLLDHGWLRLLGCGHARLTRNLLDWNDRGTCGYLLVADDVVGGFFAINGGGLGDDPGALYYRAPDSLRWEALEVGYGDFVHWALSDRLALFYQDLRWQGWQEEVAKVGGDQCFDFYPFLWSAEGSVETSSRRLVDSAEAYALGEELAQQLDGGSGQR